ncbi:hypothetical protein L210DRAFT_950558 [Boletus edulis BED1]|uniref:Uncharacterized protein n=1 Tax=Boletus edulis BED1 TaxID=1328754 RepID=A0AAD4BF52_BOLED|nr:hypothetical protein L210DRAFT_950558 [Boletus edulis BED1]
MAGHIPGSLDGLETVIVVGCDAKTRHICASLPHVVKGFFSDCDVAIAGPTSDNLLKSSSI